MLYAGRLTAENISTSTEFVLYFSILINQTINNMDKSIEHEYTIRQALFHLLFTSGHVKNPLLFTVFKLLMSL